MEACDGVVGRGSMLEGRAQEPGRGELMGKGVSTLR